MNSPTSVFDFERDSMLIQRYVIMTYPDHGAIAYDLYDTMNRQAWLRDAGMLEWRRAEHNIEALSAVRYGEALIWTLWFHPISNGHPVTREMVRSDAWMHRNGVRVPMEYYDRQVYEEEFMDSDEFFQLAMAVVSGTEDNPVDLTDETAAADPYDPNFVAFAPEEPTTETEPETQESTDTEVAVILVHDGAGNYDTTDTMNDDDTHAGAA